MSRARLFLWTAAMVVAGALLPMAEMLGLQVAGSLWNALRLTSPWLWPAGVLCGGVIGGALVGGLQWAVLPGASARWMAIAAAAGLAVAGVYLVYAPLTVIAAPIAGALAGLVQTRPLPASRWVRAQSIAAAWVALAWMLPFPRWAAAAFLVGAALLSAWGIQKTALRRGA